MKKCIIAFLVLCAAPLATVTKCYSDDQVVAERESAISNSLSLVRSSATWKTAGTNILWALDVITRENLTNAVPFLVPNISFTIGEAPDITTGNLLRVYPVLGCLVQLGKPTVDAVIEYARSPRGELTPLMIQHMRLLLITTEGKEQANRIVASAIKNESKPEAARRLQLLLVTSSNPPQSDP